MISRFPVLNELEARELSWADLMYVESRAIIGTVVALMDRDVPSLPVHDSLIVPASQVKLASDLLKQGYEREAGITPGLTVGGL